MRVLVPAQMLSCSFALVLAACGGKESGPAKTARPTESASMRMVAGLVPPDTVVYARVASLDALVATARMAVSAFGGDTNDVSREQLLASLGRMAGDTAQIDPGRAIGFALVAPKGPRPTPVVFVPVKDDAKYAASLTASGLEGAVEGDYVAVPMGGKYTKPAAPSPLADAMPAGLVAVRIDVAKAAANLGVLINSGLDVMERQMAQSLRASGEGLDGEAMGELYANFLKSLLASGTTVDLVVDEAGGRANVAVTYHAKPGSDLDGWSSPPIDLAPFAGKLSGKSAVEIAAQADWAKLWSKVEPMTAAVFDVYPPSMREAMQGLMKAYTSIYQRLGPVLVGGGDFTDGIRFDVHIAPPDAAALLAELDTLVKSPEFAKLGITFTTGTSNDSGGVSVRDYKLSFDPSRLAGAAADDEKSKAMAKEMARVFQAMFGSDGVPFRLAMANGRGVMSIGKGGGDAAKAVAPAAGTWPAGLQPAMAAVDGCNPMFVERIDFAAAMRGMGAFMPPELRGQMPTPPADAKAEFVLGGGVRGTEWRAFLTVDLTGFGAMITAMKPR